MQQGEAHEGVGRVVVWVRAAGDLVVVRGVAVADAGPQSQVTRGDPFASCPAPPDVFGGVLFRRPSRRSGLRPIRRLVEPDQVDPAGPLVGRSAQGSLRRTPGRSPLVEQTPLPFSVCASPSLGPVLRDPFAGRPLTTIRSVGRHRPDGTAYAITISFDANDDGSSIGAATSTDGGRTGTTGRTSAPRTRTIRPSRSTTRCPTPPIRSRPAGLRGLGSPREHPLSPGRPPASATRTTGSSTGRTRLRAPPR